MSNSFYTDSELELIGFKCIGKNVNISKNTTFYGVERIIIGNNVRIDDYCVISAGDNGVKIGSYVHIACFSCIFGQGGVIIEDFAGLSSRVAIYSASDDYLGGGINKSNSS
jgi:galactoside O-acetyltransferase